MISTREPRFRLIAAAVLVLGSAAWAAPGQRAVAVQGEMNGAAHWVETGRLRYRAGQHHLALQAAVKAVQADPRDAKALELRGQLVRDASGPVAALPWFERAVAQAPGDLDVMGEYAATLAEAGRHAEMLRVVRRMVEIDRRHPRAYYLQAVLAARAGLDDLALRLLRRTDGAYEDVPAGQLLAGILDLRTGNAALAVDHLDSLVRRQPDNAAASLLLGRALLANGEANELVARLGPAADKADASPYLLMMVGRAYEHLGRRKKAARYLDRAAGARPAVIAVLPVNPSDELAVAGQANAVVPRLRRLLAGGRRAEALALARQLDRRYPGSADVETLIGDVALLAGDAAGALSQYNQAATIRRDFSLVERMVAADLLLGRQAAADALVRDYLTNNPRVAAASLLLGRMRAQTGDWENGAALLSHAGSLRRGDDPRLLADLAAVELARGAPQAALESARRAYALQRADGRVAAILARILQAEGDGAEAAALLAKARQSASPTEWAAR